MIRDLSDEVKKLQQFKNGKTRDLVAKKSNLPQFPLTTIEDLKALEGLLMEKPEVCTELVSFTCFIFYAFQTQK